jgi:hypothetical protein
MPCNLRALRLNRRDFPQMPEKDLASLIRELADADSSVRERAAAELFRLGSQRIEPIMRTWLQDRGLAKYFAFGARVPGITVGIAVEPLSFDQIRVANGSPQLADVPANQDAKEFELEFRNRSRLDILTSREPGGAGAIARYLQKSGEGIQQVELYVKDVDRATEILKTRFGVQPVYPATRPGANGTRVNFFLVAAPAGGKVLIELVEIFPAAGKPV